VPLPRQQGSPSRGPARAVDFTWTGTVDGGYLTPGNWSPVGPPSGGSGNLARFITPGAHQPVIDSDVPTVQDFHFIGGGIDLQHIAGSVTLAGWMRMGVAGGGGSTYNLSGTTGLPNSALLEAGSFRVGEVDGHLATVNVYGGEPSATPAIPVVGTGSASRAPAGSTSAARAPSRSTRAC
jgi:hypothetical protein